MSLFICLLKVLRHLIYIQTLKHISKFKRIYIVVLFDALKETLDCTLIINQKYINSIDHNEDLYHLIY